MDQNGVMGGASDHNVILTRLSHHFIKVDRSARRRGKKGWNIAEDQDWTEYHKVADKEWMEAGGNDDGSSDSWLRNWEE